MKKGKEAAQKKIPTAKGKGGGKKGVCVGKPKKEKIRLRSR